jgi:hypothetical protein
MICERCCEHFAKDLDKYRGKEPFQWDSLKPWLEKSAHGLISLFQLVGGTLFFLGAMWFVPHAESPFKRKQRKLNEAFAKKSEVADKANAMVADYQRALDAIESDAKTALNVGLDEIRADEERMKRENYAEWIVKRLDFPYREDCLRRDVEAVYLDQLKDLEHKYNAKWNDQREDEISAAQAWKDAHQSAYSQ